MQVQLLGPVRAWRYEDEVVVRGITGRSVLARLALDRGATVTIEELMDAVWGDHPPTKPAANLHTAVSRLRGALGVEAIETSAGGYAMSDAAAVDVAELKHVLSGLDGADPAAALRLAACIARFGGTPIEDVATTWVFEPYRVMLRELQLVAYDHRDASLIEAGQAESTIPDLWRRAGSAPFREQTHRLLADALSRVGRATEALRVLDGFRTSLAEQSGLSPSSELDALVRRVLQDDSPSRASAPLPSQMMSPIGRGEMIDATVSALASRRLVTLLGPGGVGKTTVAIAAARRVADAGRRVLWIDLAVLSEPERVVAAVADVAELQAQVGHKTAETLRGHFRAQPSVLVLDNCEHLLPKLASIVSSWLSECPTLVVMTTSREALRVDGEKVMSVVPLPLPTSLSSESIANTAVALLEARVHDLDDGYVVGLDDRTAFVEICRALDGLPLAIELAATRMRVMSAAELASSLDDRFAVLTSDRRGGLDRHASLEATLRWSYDLLDDREQLLLDRLSVFAGAFTAKAARQICGFGTLSDGDVVDALAGLVSKSLVMHRIGSAEAGFRLLKTIREWASGSLSERGETDDVADRHATYWLEWVEELTVDTDGLAAFRPVTAEVYRSIDHLIGSESFTRAVASIQSIETLCDLGGRQHVLEDFFERLLPYVNRMEPIAQATMLYSEITSGQKFPDLERAAELAGRAIAALELAGACACEAYNMLGIRYSMAGRMPEAIEQFETAIDQPHQPSCTETVWVVRINLGWALARADRSKEARAMLDHGVAEARALGLGDFALPEVGLAVDAQRRGRVDEARDLLQGAVLSLAETDREDSFFSVLFHGALAAIELRLGDFRAAREHVTSALDGTDKHHAIGVAFDPLAVAAALAEQDGNWELAASLAGGVARWIATPEFALHDETLIEIVDRPAAEARSPLSPTAFDRAWAHGACATSVELGASYLASQTAKNAVP